MFYLYWVHVKHNKNASHGENPARGVTHPSVWLNLFFQVTNEKSVGNLFHLISSEKWHEFVVHLHLVLFFSQLHNMSIHPMTSSHSDQSTRFAHYSNASVASYSVSCRFLWEPIIFYRRIRERSEGWEGKWGCANSRTGIGKEEGRDRNGHKTRPHLHFNWVIRRIYDHEVVLAGSWEWSASGHISVAERSFVVAQDWN